MVSILKRVASGFPMTVLGVGLVNVVQVDLRERRVVAIK